MVAAAGAVAAAAAGSQSLGALEPGGGTVGFDYQLRTPPLQDQGSYATTVSMTVVAVP